VHARGLLSETGVSASAAMDALRALLRELRGCLGDADAAQRCCVGIHAAVAKDKLLRSEAARDGAVVEAMLAAVVAHPANADLQACAWGVIWALLLCAAETHTGAAAAACRQGALPAGVRALQMHVGNDEAQQYVWLALTTLIECGDESVASQLGDLGAVEAAAASLREHSTPDAAAHAAKLLFKLVKQQRQNCARALQADVLETMAAVMRMHDADGRLAYMGYSLLAHLCPYDDGTLDPRAAASNVVDLAISGLRRLEPEETDRRTAACVLLSNLCVREAMARKVVALGGVPAMLAAMRVRPVSDNVLGPGVDLLFKCCVHAPELSSSLVAAGVVEAIATAMEAQASCSNVLHSGYEALDLLTAADASAIQRAIKAGALRLPHLDDEEDGQGRDALFQRLNDAVAAAEAKADAIMAELLAEEEAAAKAGGSAASKKKKSKAKKVAGDAGGAQPAAVPPAALAARGAEGAAASAAADQPAAVPALAAPPAAPSAAAERRRRRAATKAARRSGAATSGAAAADAASSDDDAAPDDAAECSGMAAAATEEEAQQPEAASEHLMESMFPWLRMSSNAAQPAAGCLTAACEQLPPPLAPSAQDAQLAAMVAQLAEQKAAMAAQASAMAAQAAAMAAKDAALAKLKAEADAAPKCSICLDATPCVVLLPCRHQPLCAAPECAAMLGVPPLCPLCREPVADTMRTFV
jgi:hypothetical protein